MDEYSPHTPHPTQTMTSNQLKIAKIERAKKDDDWILNKWRWERTPPEGWSQDLTCGVFRSKTKHKELLDKTLVWEWNDSSSMPDEYGRTPWHECSSWSGVAGNSYANASGETLTITPARLTPEESALLGAARTEAERRAVVDIYAASSPQHRHGEVSQRRGRRRDSGTSGETVEQEGKRERELLRRRNECVVAIDQ